MNQDKSNYDVVVVGGGFTGLCAAHTLSKVGKKVLVVEGDSVPGGLASTFEFADGVKLEKFYHHWFNNDEYVPKLVGELGLEKDILYMPTKTSMFYNKKHWALSSPIDLLRFKALSLIDRIRLGITVLKIRKIKSWKSIEHLSIREWLEPLCGRNSYRVVWEPLVNSKFSKYAESISAVWMWKKLVLRGSTRSKSGSEQLAYFKGGFGRLAEEIVKSIRSYGGDIVYNRRIVDVVESGDNVRCLVDADGNKICAKYYIFTPSFEVIADIFRKTSHIEWNAKLRRINYLGNICLVLRLNKSLSSTYWLNVNDPGFPFVGVIEHTNFDSVENYAGSHIVYLSKYLTIDEVAWQYSESEYYAYAISYLKEMFPELDDSWIDEFKVFKSEYAQPVAEISYSTILPEKETPYDNVFISTMAQIYPEDRGTNYAIRDGIKIAEKVSALC